MRFIAFLATFVAFSAMGAGPDMPNPQLTPGAVLTSDLAKLCVSGYTATVRNTPRSLKLSVYKRYGVVTAAEVAAYCPAKRKCEVDHLISLELGGSNDITNLWPQPYGGPAEKKDELENALHRLVCAKQVPIDEAQHAIASDWKAAYDKYCPMAHCKPK